jgi:ankyrin repeat protein
MKNKEGLKLVKSTDTSYNTPLHLAAKEGHEEAVAELIKSSYSTHIKIDAKNELNKTPIHLASSRGHDW